MARRQCHICTTTNYIRKITISFCFWCISIFISFLREKQLNGTKKKWKTIILGWIASSSFIEWSFRGTTNDEREHFVATQLRHKQIQMKMGGGRRKREVHSVRRPEAIAVRRIWEKLVIKTEFTAVFNNIVRYRLMGIRSGRNHSVFFSLVSD